MFIGRHSSVRSNSVIKVRACDDGIITNRRDFCFMAFTSTTVVKDRMTAIITKRRDLCFMVFLVVKDRMTATTMIGGEFGLK